VEVSLKTNRHLQPHLIHLFLASLDKHLSSSKHHPCLDQLQVKEVIYFNKMLLILVNQLDNNQMHFKQNNFNPLGRHHKILSRSRQLNNKVYLDKVRHYLDSKHNNKLLGDSEHKHKLCKHHNQQYSRMW
jgi:hypothetical protein